MQDSNCNKERLVDDWIRYGGFSGLTFAILFLCIAVVPMPDRLETILALVMPLFLLVGHVGLYHFLAKHRPSMPTQLAGICGICAPALLSAMITVQLSMVSYMGRF
jgi:hypothetical protein